MIFYGHIWNQQPQKPPDTVFQVKIIFFLKSSYLLKRKKQDHSHDNSSILDPQK